MEQDRVIIETPEHVEFSYELAGLGSRFLALFVDHLFLMVGIFLLAVAVEFIDSYVGPLFGRGGELAGIPITALIIIFSAVLIYLAYFTLFEAAWDGQTLGKRMAGLRVIKVGGGPIGLIESLTRNILRLVDMLPALYLAGGIFVFFTRACQRIGDLAAGTIVVKERLWEYPGQKNEHAADGAEPDVSGAEADDVVRRARGYVGLLSGEQIETIRRFLERRDELAPETRAQLAARIAAPLRHQLADVIADESPERLLEIIYQAHLEHQQDF